jgi:hypothetical protein
MTQRLYPVLRGPLLTMLSLALLAVGCDSASSTPLKADASGCTTGNETCPCYGNKTCNQGLACLSNLCVNAGNDSGIAPGDSAPGPDAGRDATLDAAMGEAGSADVMGDGFTAESGVGVGCGGNPCTDFPPQPILDTGAPSNAGSLFGAGTGASSGGPCLYEPAMGALFPNNWPRPRFMWTASSSQNLFEIRLHSSLEASDLVVYTAQTQWTMPKNVWTGIAANLAGQPITVAIRGVNSIGGTPSLGTTGAIVIAPAAANGSLVYMSAPLTAALSASDSRLQGFRIGDETSTTMLTPAQVQQSVIATPVDGGVLGTLPVGCIDCHTVTPDSVSVGFTAQWPWPNAMASLAAGAAGAIPPWLSVGAAANLSPNVNLNYLGGASVTATNNVDNVMLGIQTFSRAHFQTGDRVEVVQLGAAEADPLNASGQPVGLQPACQAGTTICVVSQLAWIDLEWTGGGAVNRPTAAPGAPSNGGWGILARAGDPNSAGSPDWSHDGTRVAYTSVLQGTRDGRLDTPAAGSSADIAWVPYGAFVGRPGGAGGPAAAVLGASDPSYNEYYPSFSPDDALLAFARAPSATTMYAQPLAEIYVVPSAGAPQPTRLSANDPPACSGLTSPGVENSWPKWAPGPVLPSSDGLLYYWIVFSSVRINDPNSAASGGGAPKIQVYVAGVVVDPANQNRITTYPAIYAWNQDASANNLTPAWSASQ